MGITKSPVLSTILRVLLPAAAILAFLTACSSAATPITAPEPTPNIQATVEARVAEAMPTPTLTPTPTLVPTATPEPTPNIEATVEASVAKALSESATATPPPTDTPTSTPTPAPTPLPTQSWREFFENQVNNAQDCPPGHQLRGENFQRTPPYNVNFYCEAIATSTPQPSPTPWPTSTPVPTVTPLATLVPIPTLAPRENLTQLTLRLINEQREIAGVPSLNLGNNPAAQSHAESSLANCISSHWDTQGRTPQLRYTLAGGHNYNHENLSSYNYCHSQYEDHRYEDINIRQKIRETINGFMNSPDHQKALLDPHHRAVSIGIAFNRTHFTMVHQFEYHYVAFTQPPSIIKDNLHLEGRLINGATYSDDFPISVSILQQEYPGTLTRGQLANTYCSDPGTLIASIVRPPPKGSSYQTMSDSTEYTRCKSPFNNSPTSPTPTSYREATEFHTRAKANSEYEFTTQFDYIIADTWETSGSSFKIQVNIADVLKKHSPATFQFVTWATVNGEDIPVGLTAIAYP